MKEPRKARQERGASLERIKGMIEEATIDCHDESEQLMGLVTMIGEELRLPFSTEVLGVEVMVETVELNDAGELVAVCRRQRTTQRVPLVDLPLPSPPPAGAEWIEAYRQWARRR